MTIRAGLIGNPVTHSLSPVMHNAALRSMGIDTTYELWHTDDVDVPARVASIRGDDVLGANVTVPHKRAVMPYVDDVTEAARRIGAVNTLVKRGNHLIGDNTDAYGWERSFREAFPDDTPQRAMILGAGGASRSVIVALQDLGVSNVAIWNRSPERAESLAEEFGIAAVAEHDLFEAVEMANVVVNATSAGWHGELPVDVTILDRPEAGTIIADLTYQETPFLSSARARGLRTFDGLGMLLWQGVRSLGLWIGQEPPVDVMRDALLTEQARRSHPE